MPPFDHAYERLAPIWARASRRAAAAGDAFLRPRWRGSQRHVCYRLQAYVELENEACQVMPKSAFVRLNAPRRSAGRPTRQRTRPRSRSRRLARSRVRSAPQRRGPRSAVMAESSCPRQVNRIFPRSRANSTAGQLRRAAPARHAPPTRRRAVLIGYPARYRFLDHGGPWQALTSRSRGGAARRHIAMDEPHYFG